MCRSTVFAAALSLVLHAMSAFADEELNRGRPTEFELEAPKTYIGNVDDFRNSIPCFNCARIVKMTKGHDMVITATVVGDKRSIFFLVEDPAGVRLAITPATVGRSEMTVRQLSATGLYKITLMSDRIGGGVVTVRDPAEFAKVKELEGRIAIKQKELAELEEQLRVAQERDREKAD